MPAALRHFRRVILIRIGLEWNQQVIQLAGDLLTFVGHGDEKWRFSAETLLGLRAI
jgi:hypothetical protein